MNLAEKLTLIEEAYSADTTGVVTGAITANEQLEQAQRAVIAAKLEVQRAMARINGGLALAIRQAKPGLNISLERDSVTVGYYARSLRFVPDLNSKTWVVESSLPKISANFLKRGVPLQLLDDFSGLANAIGKYFTNYYKSLGENITGTGKLLLDGKLSNLSDLAALLKG